MPPQTIGSFRPRILCSRNFSHDVSKNLQANGSVGFCLGRKSKFGDLNGRLTTSKQQNYLLINILFYLDVNLFRGRLCVTQKLVRAESRNASLPRHLTSFTSSVIIKVTPYFPLKAYFIIKLHTNLPFSPGIRRSTFF